MILRNPLKWKVGRMEDWKVGQREAGYGRAGSPSRLQTELSSRKGAPRDRRALGVPIGEIAPFRSMRATASLQVNSGDPSYDQTLSPTLPSFQRCRSRCRGSHSSAWLPFLLTSPRSLPSINRSRSPSMTAWMLLVSTPVR